MWKMESQSRSPAQDHTAGKGQFQNSKPKSAGKAHTFSPMLHCSHWYGKQWKKRGREEGNKGRKTGLQNEIPIIISCCCCVTSVSSDSVWPQRWQPTRVPRPWDSPGKNTGVGCHFLLQCMMVKSESEVTQSCPTLCDPMTIAHQAPLSVEFSRQEH